MPRKCKEEKCTKSSSYNIEGETKRLYCAEHGKKRGMINVKINKKCNCGKARPNFNEPDETTGICCKDCKTNTMIDVKNKKCKCRKAQPTFNEPGETTAICCSKCKTNTMVDVKDKK